MVKCRGRRAPSRATVAKSKAAKAARAAKPARAARAARPAGRFATHTVACSRCEGLLNAGDPIAFLAPSTIPLVPQPVHPACHAEARGLL